MAVGSASSRSGRRQIGRGWVIATYVALVLFTLWTVIPFVWMILASVKTNKEIYDVSFSLVPKQIYFGHYEQLIFGNGSTGAGKASAYFGVWMRNSAYVAIVTTTASIVLGSLAA